MSDVADEIAAFFDSIPSPAELGEAPGTPAEGSAPAHVRPVPAGFTPPPPARGAGFVSQDSAAEAAILSALLTTADALDDIADELVAEDFGTRAHSAIYSAIRNLDASGRAIDKITVEHELLSMGLRAAVPANLMDNLCAGVDRAGGISDWVRIVREKALRRRIGQVAHTISGNVLRADTPVEQVLAEAEASVFGLGEDRTKSGFKTMAQVMAATVDMVGRAKDTPCVGLSTGFRKLDDLTAGLQGGQLIVVAARPGMGKTAFALRLALGLAEGADDDAIVPFISYEMNADELGMRLLSAEMEYDMNALRKGILKPGMERVMAESAQRVSQSRVVIEDNPPTTTSGIRSYARRVSRRQKIAAIVIDYLQLVAPDRTTDNKANDVGTISWGLKMLAKELDIPIIVLSQLNRGLESRPNKRPIPSDLRDSGAIEQDSSLILFLYRDHVYNPAADETHAELIIGKNRNGPMGTVAMTFEGAKGAKFSESDRTLAPALAAAPAGAPADGGGGFGGGGFGGGGFSGGGRKSGGGTPF